MTTNKSRLRILVHLTAAISLGTYSLMTSCVHERALPQPTTISSPLEQKITSAESTPPSANLLLTFGLLLVAGSQYRRPTKLY